MRYDKNSELFRTGMYAMDLMNSYMAKMHDTPNMFTSEYSAVGKRSIAAESNVEGIAILFQEAPRLSKLLHEQTNRVYVNEGVMRSLIHVLSESFYGGLLKSKIVDQDDYDEALHFWSAFRNAITTNSYKSLIANVTGNADAFRMHEKANIYPDSLRQESIRAIASFEKLANTFGMLEAFHIRALIILKKKILDGGFSIPSEPSEAKIMESTLRSNRRTFELYEGEDIEIWRYFDFPKFIALVEDSELFFPSAEILSKSLDPAEGEFTDADDDEFEKEYIDFPIIQQVVKETGVDLKKMTYINSWHIANEESKEMWNTYVKSYGIAIKTTCLKLRNSIQRSSNIEVYVTKVKYLDPSNDLTDLHGITSSFVNKRLGFKFEKELRLLFVDPICESVHGKRLPVNLTDLIEEVIVKPSTEEWVIELIRRILNRAGVSAPVRRSSLE